MAHAVSKINVCKSLQNHLSYKKNIVAELTLSGFLLIIIIDGNSHILIVSDSTLGRSQDKHYR